jgi:hypothetical protein
VSGRAFLVRWGAHLGLLALMGAQCLVAVAVHQDAEELARAAAEGTGRERVAAMHVLANRGEPDPALYTDQRVKELMGDPDPLVVDFLYTVDICRFSRPRTAPVWQNRIVNKMERMPRDPGELADLWRRFVIYRRKVGDIRLGSLRRLEQQELEWFCDARAGRPLDVEELRAHLMARFEDSLWNAGEGDAGD